MQPDLAAHNKNQPIISEKGDLIYFDNLFWKKQADILDIDPQDIAKMQNQVKKIDSVYESFNSQQNERAVEAI